MITVPASDHPDLFLIQDYEICDLVFNGISREKGVLKEHYIVKRDFISYHQYLMTTTCKKRVSFLISNKNKE